MQFFFYINYDKHDFYVEPGLGNCKHTHHSPINGPSKQKNKRGIAQDEQDLINDMAEGQAQDIQMQNFLFNKTGKLIPTFTIWQIVNDSDFDDIFDNTNKADLSVTEYMMEYCRSKNYNFQILLNDPFFSSKPTSETYKNDRKNPIIESILDFNSREMENFKLMFLLAGHH